MTPESITLAAAILAAVASIMSLFVNSKLTISRERRQQLWQYDLEQIRGIEQLAGRITELISGYPSLDKIDKMLPPLINEFEQKKGKYRRYPILNQAMRDFHNAVDRVVDSRRNHEIPTSDKEDLTIVFNDLVTVCDKVLEKSEA